MICRCALQQMAVFQSSPLQHNYSPIRALPLWHTCNYRIVHSIQFTLLHGVQDIMSFEFELGHGPYCNVRARLRPGTCYILVLAELRCICGMDTQGDKSLLDAWAEMR